MNKFERKLKEATAQTTASLLAKLRTWKKDWKRGSLMEIAYFLRQYDRANVKIDASPFDRHMINEQIFRL